MGTYFDTIKRSYIDVPTANGVDTSEFISATEAVVGLFDLLGTSAFSVVQNDMNGNIKELVKNEGAPGAKGRTATEGLLWLLRGLDFTAKALRRSIESDEELSVSFTKAYEVTLRAHHSFVVRPIFAVAMKACPYRKDFYAKLGQPQDVVAQKLRAWLEALEKIVRDMQQFYEQGGYAKGL
ncbi:hypothetical protein MCUN1_002921 [Malassezia cuniculi]|uniref:Glycolipid transfer protein domain-containing protein n=1 Tax=Malassezia cuniculi TaxID=948313 RepID=A0AAF0EVY7_9BASI|nr:hypothetical protein MCUN1_002921 [Malassezia cuniculi]